MPLSDLLTFTLLAQVLAASIRLSTPLVLAALGEIVAERSGVLNLGVEGIMLVGGLAAFGTAVLTGNLWWGVLAALLVGGLLGLLFAYVTVSLRSDQIVAGLALLIACTGGAAYIYRVQFASAQQMPSMRPFTAVHIPVLSELPVIGPILFSHGPFTYIMLALVPIIGLILYRTPFGAHMMAVGEYPPAADTVGINVYGMRYLCVIAGGCLAGLAGAYFSLSELGVYTDSMIGGRGFIALALVVFGRWDPYWTLAGGLVFGAVDALQSRLQSLGIGLPSHFLIVTPYVLTIIVLLIGRRRDAPAALAIPYVRE
jgi:general nucleoside transport system permease protein